jgi:hypothetical protein
MKTRHATLSIIILIIIIVLAVIAGFFLLSGGFPSPLSTFTSSKSVGAVPVIENTSPQKIGLNTAFSQLNTGSFKYQSNMPDTKIFSATGLHLDNEGNADSWLFIARQQNETKYIEINGRGLTTNAWYGSVPITEINPRNVVLPEDVFKTQQSRLKPYIDDTWDFYSIDLKNNNYTLTLKKGPDQKIFIFRAINGELIEG